MFRHNSGIMAIQWPSGSNFRYKMSEDLLAAGSGLLLLPEEILLNIAKYLNPCDLLAVSQVCHHLRSVLNTNSVWKKYTDGGLVGRKLDNINCLVQPVFNIPTNTSLEPLCDHRLYFLKQSRLLNNLRQGKFVEHSMEFHGFLSDFETLKPLNNRQVTYQGKYLFTTDYEGETEVIKVFDIENSLRLSKTVPLENHSAEYFVITWVQIVEDKLIVRRDDWFDIYGIKLPEIIITQTINVNKFGNQRINQTLIIGNFLFVENFTLNAIHIWNLSSGMQSDDLHPEVQGNDFSILGYSQNQKYVLLSVGMYVTERCHPHISVYDIESQAFSHFSPLLNERTFKCHECYGLMDSNYVVILNERSSLVYSVFVFDYHTSSLLAEKTNLVTRRIEDARIVKGFLVLPSLVSVLVMNLKSLQIVWELQLDTARSLVYEFPMISMVAMEVLNISTLDSLIVIHKVSGIEIWDLLIRKKLLDLTEKGRIVLSDTFTKIIFSDLQTLKVFTFW